MWIKWTRNLIRRQGFGMTEAQPLRVCEPSAWQDKSEICASVASEYSENMIRTGPEALEIKVLVYL